MRMKTQKRNWRYKKTTQIFRVMSALLALMICFSLVLTSASALSINGEGQGISGASSTSSGSYAIKSTEYVIGFRFALVDEDGQAVDVTKKLEPSQNAMALSFLPIRFRQLAETGQAALDHLRLHTISDTNITGSAETGAGN